MRRNGNGGAGERRWEMKAEGSSYRGETFSSEVIDLSGIDLSLVDALPSSVLRSAVRRVCAELTDNGETSAYFQSSLRAAVSQEDEVTHRRKCPIRSADDDGA
jgi:FXSXX-COOH protein